MSNAVFQQPENLLPTSQVWQDLSGLAGALMEDNLDKALQMTLAAGSALTGAEALAIYLMQVPQPFTRRLCFFGPQDALPEELLAQDMIFLSKPRLWQAGKRPVCSLYRMARAAQLSYVASAPIGEREIGLLVIADHRPLENHDVLGVAGFLAGTAHAIIQRSALHASMQAELSQQDVFRRFGAVFEERSMEGILLLDPGLRILRINTAAEMALGYTSREVIGQPVEKVLIGPENLMPAMSAAQTGSPTYNLGDARLYRRDGEDFPALVRIFPVMEGQRVEQVIIFIQDQSEQVQNRLQLQQLEQRALLGEVTAIFAHEVRNPINNISTGLQLLAINLPEGDPGQEQVGRMLQDCDRLVELMNGVLTYSRPYEYVMEKLDLTSLLQRLLDRLRPRITKVNVQYSLKTDPECPPILGDLRALEQVFTNLISNALNAMKEKGGNLVIQVQPDFSPEGRRYVEVGVADTGPGISKELLDHIWKPFYTTGGDGTGLGLPIVKRIITAHKGNVRVTSFPGGTIFYVQLPVATG